MRQDRNGNLQQDSVEHPIFISTTRNESPVMTGYAAFDALYHPVILNAGHTGLST